MAKDVHEIREQCAWLGGLIGFPILGGLPDTYAMMATGGKGLQKQRTFFYSEHCIDHQLFRQSFCKASRIIGYLKYDQVQ